MQLFILSISLLSIIAFSIGRRGIGAQKRLAILVEDDPDITYPKTDSFAWDRAKLILANHQDYLGQSGLTDRRERTHTIILLSTVSLTIITIAITAGLASNSAKGLILGVIIGGYTSFLTCWSYLRFLQQEYQRRILFALPLALESLILLVETGLGILPAIEHYVRTTKNERTDNPISALLQIVYDFSSNGMELSQALELVAHASPISAVRHTLLHLDLSGNEGGEIIPSLRSLSDHAHKEWRLSVEHRVRRLENLVVFPVFVSVIGLLLLTAAVPLVPVLELRDSLKRSNFPTSEKQLSNINPGINK